MSTVKFINEIIEIRGVQPFAIADRITFIYMEYGRQ